MFLQNNSEPFDQEEFSAFLKKYILNAIKLNKCWRKREFLRF